MLFFIRAIRSTNVQFLCSLRKFYKHLCSKQMALGAEFSAHGGSALRSLLSVSSVLSVVVVAARPRWVIRGAQFWLRGNENSKAAGVLRISLHCRHYMTVRDSSILTRSVSEAASLTLRVSVLPIRAL